MSRQSRTEAEAGPLRVKLTRRDVRAMLGCETKLDEPLQRGVFDGGFSQHRKVSRQNGGIFGGIARRPVRQRPNPDTFVGILSGLLSGLAFGCWARLSVQVER